MNPVGTMRPTLQCSRASWRAGLLSACHHSRFSTSSMAAVQAASTEASLENWVVGHGGQVNGINITRTPGQGYGLQAAAKLSPGQRLVLLPRQCIMTYDADSDPRLLSLIQQIPAELWGAKLAIQLLSHRVQAGDSSFASYVSQLPVGVNGIPMFFGKDGVDAIQYPPVIEQVKKRGRWLFKFSKVLDELPNTPADPFDGCHVDMNALGWAMACVTSRAFRLAGPSQPASLLPVIDMANHSFDPNCEVLPIQGQKGAAGLFAKRQIEPGEPILLSYGPLPNDFLFLDYGFVMRDNPHDYVGLSWSDELLEASAEFGRVLGTDGLPLENFVNARWKKRWLEQVKLVGPGANQEVTLGGPQLVDARALAALRVVVATSESEIQGRTLARLGDLAQPISKANENTVLRLVAGMALLAFSRFPTSLQADDALLQGLEPSQDGVPSKPLATPLAEDVKAAIAFRACKKETLTRVMQGLGKRIQEVRADATIPATASPAPLKKGQKPVAASEKGFGSGGGNSK